MAAAGWYTAEIIVEIRVAGDARRVLHRNLVLVAAPSAEEAYRKALEFGAREDLSYRNPSGAEVLSRFLGLAELEYLYEEPGDGAEVAFWEQIVRPGSGSGVAVKQKSQLRAFLPPQPTSGPDYSAGDVMAAAKRLMRGRCQDPEGVDTGENQPPER